MIRRAVEELYSVKVVAVRTIRQKGIEKIWSIFRKNEKFQESDGDTKERTDYRSVSGSIKF